MSGIFNLFDLASGRPTPQESEGRAARAQLMVRATLASVLFAAIYGLAAGSTEAALAVGNVYKMPMVILLSTLVAVPAALLAWKLTGAASRASDLLIGIIAGNFTATLVLAALAPLVALYYHTTGSMGGTLALAVGGLAFVVGMVTLVRSVWSRTASQARSGVLLPLAVLCLTQTAALVQFIHVASPILPEVTVFDGGVDTMLGG